MSPPLGSVHPNTPLRSAPEIIFIRKKDNIIGLKLCFFQFVEPGQDACEAKKWDKGCLGGAAAITSQDTRLQDLYAGL